MSSSRLQVVARQLDGNGNGFRPVTNDPEAPEAPTSTSTSSLMPSQDVDDGGPG